MNTAAARRRNFIVLASASPRRRELLRQIGADFRLAPVEIDESVQAGEDPATYVLRLARAKALAAHERNNSGCPVLGADTAVVIDGQILGKPADVKEAAGMLRRLSGRSHEVFTAVAVALPGQRVLDRLNVTCVSFAALEPEWIRHYCSSGDPLDKAGAYGVQGLAAEKIVRIEGSFSGVMGLPLYETAQLLDRAEMLL
ncbi:MAG: nucleoside triphosphate pyrophosphatase [Xanthomonadales bacterium]|nr:nucleoside triphosphate pyrophosphatase [Xanthomonadales bacterium]